MKITAIIAIIIIVVSVVCVCLAGCTPKVDVVKPNVKTPAFAKPDAEVLSNEEYRNAINDFAFDLFKTLKNEDNACVSPLSIYLAFAILSNGADGDTLEQIAETMNLEPEEIKEYCSYLYKLYQDDESNADVVKIANSVWFKEVFAPKQSFVDDAFNYFDADIIKANFDAVTVRQTNAWVKEKTNGMIDKIVDKYSSNTILQIIDALTFIDDWSSKLGDGTREFTNADGTKKTVDGGWKTLNSYYETEKAEGFSYAFENQRFSFIGILPKCNVEEYLDILDGVEFQTLLSNRNDDYDKVKTFVPYFELDYDVDLIPSLKSSGIIDAFDPIKANFSNGWDTSKQNVFVSVVKHKTHFELSQTGVRAAAATTIMADCTSVAPDREPKIKFITLDRPFVYMIIDNVYNVPIFIGTVKTL